MLALVAALVGPMGMVQTAQAAQAPPRFRIGTDHGYEYVNFINTIRARINDGGRTVVDGAGNSFQVNHTNTTLLPGPSYPSNRNAHDAYLQVDIQMWGSSNFVRLQLQRADLYVIGWWDRENVYHYLGNRTVPQAEREREENGNMRNADSVRRAPFEENYVSMETRANERRANMAISRDSISSAAWYLFDANNDQNMARGVLRMTQFISEPARLRPLRDNIAAVIGADAVHFIPPQLAAQENNWAKLSGRFNWLLGFPQGHRDPQPLTAYRRGTFGDAVAIVLFTAAQYAQYVLATSKGRN
ncbi:ribosome-inactivating family protein [Streptomyces sp. NBC_01314]|uniref:ribosome-inactivating family protein n=1 Tax=Streptomyces sp. NBC_01314 TaxID=2903821 RepID=UPI00308C02E5|nr:ribosome-inactivating family protein [Streptomyces sp. NBC_01314]